MNPGTGLVSIKFVDSKMKYTVCYVLLLVAVTTSARRFRCDYAYHQETEGYFKYHEIPANWPDARLRCHLEGSILASPLDLDMQTCMKSVIAQKSPNRSVFTGIHATFSKGDFASVEGIPLSKITHVWASNEPNNVNDDEDCIIMLPDGKLADANCKTPYPYLCYKKSDKNMVMNTCGTIDLAYVMDTRTRSCYKFHTVPRSWPRAYRACMAEGAHLAIINSEIEAQVIREIYAKNPSAGIRGAFNKDMAFMGFHDWNEHGDWLTINGQALQDAGYDKFSGGEPNNATTGEFCGGVYRNGLLHDTLCYSKFVFICEKSPGSLLCNEDSDEIQ